MAQPFESKTAIVTGSSRGIGKAIALGLAAEGANVVVCARTETTRSDLPGSLAETVDALQQLGNGVLAVKVDVTNDDDLRSLVDQTIDRFGRIDFLINNAGLATGAPSFLDATADSLDVSYLTNVRGPFVLTQLVAKKMVEAREGGVIINISSGAARNRPPVGEAPLAGAPTSGTSVTYGMSKAALDRFGTGIAAELAVHNIAVINLNPGATMTERNQMNPRRAAGPTNYESTETTAKAVSFLCQNAMGFAGRVLTSRLLIDEQGL